MSQGAKHEDDALASLKTLLILARSVRIQRRLASQEIQLFNLFIGLK